MLIANSEILALNGSDIEALQAEFKNRNASFWKLFALTIFVGAPIGALGRRTHPRTFHDYVVFLPTIYFFSLLFLAYFYYTQNYQIKRDLLSKTKLRFRTVIDKTKGNDEISKKANCCNIILTSVGLNANDRTEMGLSYYLKKNMFPPKKFIVSVPIDKYLTLRTGEGIIEISNYARLFLDFVGKS